MTTCRPGLVYNSPLNHTELRKLTRDGRCPICDPEVSRIEYLLILGRLLREPDLRARVSSK